MVIDEPANRVFITDVVDNNVRVLDAGTAAVLRTVPVGAMPGHDSQRIAVDARTNRVFVAGAGVQVLDARTGAFVNTVMGGDGSLAVDARTERAFAANYDGSSVSVLDARSGRILRTIPVSPAPLHLAVDTFIVPVAADLRLISMAMRRSRLPCRDFR